MKQVIGILMILGGLALGLYVGIYVCFIGGVIQLISSVTPVLHVSGVAWGLARVLFAGFLGTISLAGLAVPGAVLLEA